MRPYRFRMRSSSKRLNVTRLGKGPAAALRAAAWLSLGSASSDIELMLGLPSSQRHDCADSARPQEGRGKTAWIRRQWDGARPCPARQIRRHGLVSGIIIPPHFRPATAVLHCEKKSLRWPGPFGSGFLSPQPPGVVRIGPVRRYLLIPTLGQRELVLLFVGYFFVASAVGRSRECTP